MIQRLGIPLLLVCLLFAAAGLHGQIRPNPNEDDDSEFGMSELPGADQDTLPQKKVNPATQLLDMGAAFELRSFRNDLHWDIGELMYRDELDLKQSQEASFVIGLGQIGKPYRRYRYGLPAELLSSDVWINPLNGKENVYIYNPEKDIRYFDSRTPYINVDFGQGAQDLSSLTTTVSSNINPFVNTTFVFRRRQSEGPYFNNITDHYNLYLSTHANSKDNRYHIFTNAAFNELNDQLNGGVYQADSVFTFGNYFEERQEPVSLESANLNRTYRNFFFRHFYNFLPDTSLSPHRIQFFNDVLIDEYRNQFTDTLFDPTIFSFPYPIYPTSTDSLHFLERSLMRSIRYREGLSYRFKGKQFETGHRFFVKNELIRFTKEEESFRQDNFVIDYQGDVELKPETFSVGGDLHVFRRTSNFFPAEQKLEANAFASLFKPRVDYSVKRPQYYTRPKDSIMVPVQHRPVKVTASYLRFSRNPSYLNSFYTGYPGNSFSSERSLRNQRIEHARAGFQYRGRDTLVNGNRIKGSRLGVSVFNSRSRDLIYYDDSLQLQQSAVGDFLNWQGVEARFRFKFGKRRTWGIENYTVLQRSSTNATGDLADYFLDFQPEIYGKASLFYENYDLKIAAVLRFGVDIWYFTRFQGRLFDPAHQLFYPQNDFTLPPYGRIDAFVGTQVKRAYIWVRMQHVSQDLFRPGYMTTAYYPMLNRTLMLGVNWTFFD